jgi:hypothetical protein
MSQRPVLPELAGLATYADAARVGWSVNENVRRLLRLHWTERRLMTCMLSHLTAEPVWEVKCALALHQWQCAGKVTMLRGRIAEMRTPVPPLDVPPDDAAGLDAFLEELLHSRSTAELVAGVYGVALPALAEAYRAHLVGSNPLVDHPTRQIVRAALGETEEALAWGERALAMIRAADDAACAEADAWRAHLNAYLMAAGGIAGDDGSAGPSVAEFPARATEPFVPDFVPARDARFTGQYNFEFAPHVVYAMDDVPADERNLALLCKRTLEMDVPEMMASFMVERAGEPWEFHHDYSRQLWDEARHAMMGSVALESRGIDWRREVPLNVSFALRLNLHATPVERQVMLFAIEQSLMSATTGKRSEYETALAAGDPLSAHFHDYDWADEVLHAQIGRRALRREGLSAAEARDQAAGVHERTWAALAQYAAREPQVDWWPAFVKRVLGRESAVAGVARPALRVFSE